MRFAVLQRSLQREAAVSLLNGDKEAPPFNVKKYILIILVIGLIVLGGWYVFRFYPEKKAVTKFLDAAVAGDLEQAYRIWKPQPSYTYQNFLEDWGPNGFYGPVKSYRIETAEKRKGASGVIVVVRISPYERFPSDDDAEKQRRTKEARICV